jgi:SAM-dependent methyltransferase
MPKFSESVLAHKLLDGLSGIEIGASAHNPFGLNTINVDRSAKTESIYTDEEMRICGEIARVDVVAEGDNLPFPDKSFDFVISSHVIEHFYNPLKVLKEWERVARRFIFIICPHKNRTFDEGKPTTTLQELIERAEESNENREDRHWTIWTTESFTSFVQYFGYKIHTVHDTDDKAANGFTVVIELN